MTMLQFFEIGEGENLQSERSGFRYDEGEEDDANLVLAELRLARTYFVTFWSTFYTRVKMSISDRRARLRALFTTDGRSIGCEETSSICPCALGNCLMNEAVKAVIVAIMATVQEEHDAQLRRLERMRYAIQRLQEQLSMYRSPSSSKEPEYEVCQALEPAQMEEVRRQLGIKENIVAIALVGDAGVGKSTLCNAIRGLSPSHPHAAKAGPNAITEVIKGYAASNLKADIYDIPGAGCMNNSPYTYFQDQKLFAFQALIVVWDCSISCTILAIVRNAQLLNIPVFLVRSKSDVHLDNVIQDTLERLGFDDESGDGDGVENVDEERDAMEGRPPIRRRPSRSELMEHAKDLYRQKTIRSLELNFEKAGIPLPRHFMISHRSLQRVVSNIRTPAMIASVEYDLDEIKLLEAIQQEVTNLTAAERTTTPSPAEQTTTPSPA